MLFIHGAIFADFRGPAFYTERGETPGARDRLQRGGIDGLNAGDAVIGWSRCGPCSAPACGPSPPSGWSSWMPLT